MAHLHRFFSLAILFSVLSSNFIVSGVKSSRLYPFLLLNVTLFSIFFTYICTDGYQYLLHAFLQSIQNNLECLIQNTIHLAIQIYHSMLVQIFQIYCYCMSFLCFSLCNKCYDLIRQQSVHKFLNLICYIF